MKKIIDHIKNPLFLVKTILLIIIVLLWSSCSKDKDLLIEEETETEKMITGISIEKEGEFSATNFYFSLKKGGADFYSGGMSFENNPATELKEGSYLIHKKRLFHKGEELEFNSYIQYEDRIVNMESITVIKVKEGELTRIVIWR